MAPVISGVHPPSQGQPRTSLDSKIDLGWVTQICIQPRDFMATTRYIRYIGRDARTNFLSFHLQTVGCYMPHDRQRGEDLCSVNEREHWLLGRSRQRTSRKVRVCLVNRQHAARRSEIVRFASQFERIKGNKVLTSIRALRTFAQSAWKARHNHMQEGRPILTVHS